MCSVGSRRLAVFSVLEVYGHTKIVKPRVLAQMYMIGIAKEQTMYPLGREDGGARDPAQS